MAKALYGHVAAAPDRRLLDEVTRLRATVQALEFEVTRLRAENAGWPRPPLGRTRRSGSLNRH